MTKVHLDTDIGGDIDDLCALAMLLKWPGVELTGVTTVAEEGGRRAGYARYVLDLAGRADVHCAAGADLADGYFRYSVLSYPPDEDNWPQPIPRRPGPVDEALSLLKASIEQGATLIGIGPFTNFRLVDRRYAGILKGVPLFLMAGYVDEIPPGYPAWKKHDDWNIQTEVASAEYVFAHATPTLIPLTVSTQTALRRSDLVQLGQAGPLGKLIVRQAEVFARDEGFEHKFGGNQYAGLPDDIINFQHDPLACAVALGWRDGVEIETVPLQIQNRDGWLYERILQGGMPMPLVRTVDGPRFDRFWVDLLCGQS